MCVLIRDETIGPEGGRMICTLIPNILPMTVDGLHSDSQPLLGLDWKTLTGQTQGNVCA